MSEIKTLGKWRRIRFMSWKTHHCYCICRGGEGGFSCGSPKPMTSLVSPQRAPHTHLREKKPTPRLPLHPAQCLAVALLPKYRRKQLDLILAHCPTRDTGFLPSVSGFLSSTTQPPPQAERHILGDVICSNYVAYVN